MPDNRLLHPNLAQTITQCLQPCDNIPTVLCAAVQDLSAKPGPGSCRAGGVVHLLNANNQKVPVTLHISQRDNGDHVHHVVQVRRDRAHRAGEGVAGMG